MNFEGIYVAVLKRTIKNIGEGIQKENGRFYLPDALVISETLLMQLARVMGLIYKTDLTDELLMAIQSIYISYDWIIKRINPGTGDFAISGLEELREVQETLLPLIEKVAPLFHLPDPPYFDEAYT